MRILALLCPLALLVAPAYAQDDLDDLPNYGEEEDEDLPEPDEADGEDLPQAEDDDEDGFDFTDEEEEEPPDDGAETSAIFSATFEELKALPAEERSSRWDQYLQKYPQSAYRDRIVQLQQEALDELYDERIETGGPVRASRREILLTESILLDNMNPATRLKIGFDWGLPAWINLIGDLEYALSPNFSVHGGLRKRYTGWSVEAGSRVAFMKSKKLQTVGALLADVRTNVDPAFIGLRPQLAFGIKIGDRVDLQAQGGVELASAHGFWTQTAIGGSNVTVRASKGVALYAEGLFYAKYIGWPAGTFRFHVVGFGMKFFPGQKDTPEAEDPMEMTFGASVPWSYFPIPNWEFHQGSVIGQASFYLDD